MAPSIKPVTAPCFSLGGSNKSGLFTAIQLFIVLLSTITARADSTILTEPLSTQEHASANGPVAGTGADAPLLQPGKPIERKLAGGEAHSYQLKLAAGQYARIVVDQRRINLAVSAFDYTDKKIAEVDMFPIGDSETISFVAEADTNYRLEVRSPDKAVPEGSYEIKIKELRAATEADKSAVAAQRLVAEGILLCNEATIDGCRKAIDKYKESIPLWRSAKDPAWEATAFYLIGNIYIFLGDKQKAFDFSNQALPLAQAASKQSDEEKRLLGIKVEANTLDTIGAVHSQFGDKKKALELFNQALLLTQGIGDRVRESDTLDVMGRALLLMGEYQRALEVSSRGRLIAEELGDLRKEATLMNNICVILSDMGEHKKGIDLCTQSLSIRRSLNDTAAQATPLNNIGNTYSDLGEYQMALDSYAQSHAIYRATGSLQGQAIALNNIGATHAALGDHQKALGFYNQALEILRGLGDQYRAANAMSNIGVEYASLGDVQNALDIHLQVLAVRRAVHDSGGEANSLNKIANCYQRLGEKQKALEYYGKALALFRDVGNRRLLTTALNNIGVFYRESGEPEKAMDYLTEGLQLSRSISDRNDEARILAEIAQVERDRGGLAEAKSRIEEALAAVESLRINVKSYQLRASFLASVRQYYELDIDILMRLHKQRPSEGFDAAALHASEAGRARTLLESLTEANAEIRRDAEPSLLERERSLHQMISVKSERQMRSLSEKPTEDQAAATAKEIDELTIEYDQVQAQIREKSPRYAALTQPSPLNLRQIQRAVLDGETLLLEYALGEERSYLWVVTPSSISSFELPKRAEIESAARHAYEMLIARNRTVAGETAEEAHKRIQQSDAEYPRTSVALSQMLLGPVATELKNKRLLIVGEGALQYLPFAALPEPAPLRPETTSQRSGKTGADGSLNGINRPPLVVEHEIISLPSASVLAVLRRETAGRETAEKTVAVLADPVFSSDDPRVKALDGGSASKAIDSSSVTDAKRSATESGLSDLLRLRFSRQEADQIVRLASEGKKLEAVDFAANRATATSPGLGHYAILHFATHGLINNQHPELSGVVLSLVDERGRPQNGFLRLYDIYNLKLDADLVVLSACQTALGKEIKGEGLMGLTRGFMYAGAPRVVASLWQVYDRATAELMGRFYEAMLGEQLRPSAALRAAQISMWKEKRWQAPYYWAAFTLQGEWK